jgi:hypothetical protein
MKTKNKTTDVQRLVFRMVTENTGVHFLDSGFANGRMWQRNAKKTINDFIREPEESYTFDNTYGYIDRTVSVFHYLCGLELDEVCEKFNRRNTNPADHDGNSGVLEDTYGVSERAGNWLKDNHEVEVEHTFNTYNGDSDLSQILQGSRIDIDGDMYYLIQVHGGADARGGYTDAKLFKTRFYSDGIHEYLQEYKDSYEINQDLEEGYLDDVVDDGDKTIIYTSQQILDRIKEIKEEDERQKHIKKVMQELMDECTAIKNS